MSTAITTYVRAIASTLTALVVAIAATATVASAAPPQPGPTNLGIETSPPELVAWVTVDCDDFTDPIRVHVTNNSAQPQGVEIDDGVGYGWTLDPGETRQGPVWFNSIEANSASVSVSAKDGPVFFSEVIPFDHSCFGPSPDYSVNFDCTAGVASVLFTNYAITPTWVGVVYPPQPPADFDYVTHISPVETVLALSPGEAVHVELYGDGHVMFNGDIDFDCGPAAQPEIAIEPPAPTPGPAGLDLSWLEQLIRKLRSVVRWTMVPRW